MYNKTTVVGYLGRDPELRFTPSGQSVCTFNVASSRNWTDQNGQRQEKTTWFKVTTWGKQAEICNQYLSKGRLVLVEGEIEASAWTDKEGNARATLELTAKTVKFLGGGDHEDGEEKPQSKPAAQKSAAQKPAQKPQSEPTYVYDEEDIPF